MNRYSVVILALFLSISPGFAKTRVILALGDSLTAGLGLAPQDSFPAKLEVALKAKGHDVRIINGGVSGDTAANGAARLDWALTAEVDAVIVELGANDALRGLDPVQMDEALGGIMATLTLRKLPVLLAGMKAPPNLGADYGAGFEAVFQRLGGKPGVIYYPFFLEGVAANPKFNQADGLHPTAQGVDVIVGRMLPQVEELLSQH
jgi:acyl-CoA thioesterase I